MFTAINETKQTTHPAPKAAVRENYDSMSGVSEPEQKTTPRTNDKFML